MAIVSDVSVVANVSTSPDVGRTGEIVWNVALMTTGEAAKALGIGRATLARWWADKKVAPTFITAGGHARWDLEDLRRQVAAWRDRERDE